MHITIKPHIYHHEFGTTTHGANPKLWKILKKEKGTASAWLENAPHRGYLTRMLDQFQAKLPTQTSVGPSIMSYPVQVHLTKFGLEALSRKLLHIGILVLRRYPRNRDCLMPKDTPRASTATLDSTGPCSSKDQEPADWKSNPLKIKEKCKKSRKIILKIGRGENSANSMEIRRECNGKVKQGKT